MAKTAKKAQERKEEVLARKHAEENLDRKIKSRIPWNFNCSVRVAKLYIKKEPLIKKVTCPKCGKTYKTNRDTKLCFDCEKK